MNKRLLLFVFAAGMLSNTQSRAMESLSQNTLAKVGAGLISIAALSYGSEWLFNQKFTHTICKKIGLSPIGTRQVAFLSTGALSLGYLTEGTLEVSNSLYHFAKTAPFIGLTNVLLKKQAVRDVISRIPVLGSYLVCPLGTQKQVEEMQETMEENGIEEKEIKEIQICEGSCEHCSGIDAIRLVAGWTILRFAVPAALQQYNIIK
jgi:hypothetical protein